jgi:NAD(P)H-hydrate epimerase
MWDGDGMMSLSRQEVRELDRRAIEEYGVPGIVLMENAGRGAAEVLARLRDQDDHALIICGPGNNGGDGFVIARHLELLGVPAKVWLAGLAGKLPTDASANYNILVRASYDCHSLEPPAVNHFFSEPPGIDRLLYDLMCAQQEVWIVDALFGTGLTRPVVEPYDRIVSAINASGAPVLAVDIPSGLDCDTGKPLGPCVRADHTVTFVAPKAGFANPEAKEWLGEVHVVGIGAPRALVKQYGVKVPPVQ